MPKTERRNGSVEAEFYDDSLMAPFAEGGLHFAAKGEYTEGHRKGKTAVCKWFKTGHVYQDQYFDEDIRAMKKSVELIAEWNQHRFIEQRIRVNVPEVWTFAKSDFFEKDTKVLVEPFIENYRKFNSNTGWNDSSTPWPQVMQALSHFTYHISNGAYLVCDIQGGIDSKAVILTDPAILPTKKEFGPLDLGPKGISSFSGQHKCNRFCQQTWRKPHDCTQYLQPYEGTSMMSGEATMAPPPPRFSNHVRGVHASLSTSSNHRSTAAGRATMHPPPPRFAVCNRRTGHVVTTIMPPPPNKRKRNEGSCTPNFSFNRK